MKTAVSFVKIHKKFGSLKALNRISFDIQPGEFFALLGPNGAGKTTLISVLAGLLKQDSGQASVMGYDTLLEKEKARRSLGVVPQEMVFDPFFTVREALFFQSGYFGLRRNADWIDEIITRLALTDKTDVPIRQLSGGLKRRLMIAQALVHRPSVIVLDEPTAGVDIALRQSLWVFIKELNRQGHTILLTTHYLEEAEALCNQVAMLKEGKLVLLEAKNKLLKHGIARTVILRLSKVLPEGLMKKWQCDVKSEQYFLKLKRLADLAAVLADIKKANITAQEITVSDIKLEDVFLKIMQSGKTQ